MPSGETAAHRHLKVLAAQWAIEQGYRSVGYEISLPQSGYRADVSAYRWASDLQSVDYDGKKRRQRQPVIGSTAIFECKQAWADLCKDFCQRMATKGFSPLSARSFAPYSSDSATRSP